MSKWNENVLLMTDTYKLGHMEQYPEDTVEIYSYLEARKANQKTVFFGLQYLLQEYLTRPITKEDGLEFLEYYRQIIGAPPEDTVKKINALTDLGYWPLFIKAVSEGTIIDSQNALMTIRNTIPGFHWCVGFLESLLLKVWNASTVATCSLKYRTLVERYVEKTCDNNDHIPFAVHDFGYRGVSSEETAMVSGGAHLLNFYGSDTVIANKFLDQYYPRENKETILGLSVPASEHSVMCSYGREGELEAFRHMLKIYPTGIVSIVSDTYDLWNVLENFTEELTHEILDRPGKTVFRPDSGNPAHIICGDPDAELGSPAHKGALQILWDKFGGYVNKKGYKTLNPAVGLIYGDGMFYERFEEMLSQMETMGFASSNLVIGVGGILLQQHTRDEFGYALKATRIIRGKDQIDIFKDPITDPGKKSKKGLMYLNRNCNGFETHDQVGLMEENAGFLLPVFENSSMLKTYSIEEVRKNLNESL